MSLGKAFETSLLLYVAGAWGALVTILLLATAIWSPDDFDYSEAWFALLAVGLAFYLAVILAAPLLARQTRGRRGYLALMTAGSLAIAFMGGGVASLIAFAPSMILMLMLTIRG